MSREKQIVSEWMLRKDVFEHAISTFNFKPDIDFFASRVNHQLKPYVSFKPDPEAIAIDAFSLNWSKYSFYAFPPFSVVLPMFQKIAMDQATGICVVPQWPTQLWYPKQMKMLVHSPIVVQPSKDLLNLPIFPQEVHPLHKTLKLMICSVSGTVE